MSHLKVMKLLANNKLQIIDMLSCDIKFSNIQIANQIGVNINCMRTYLSEIRNIDFLTLHSTRLKGSNKCEYWITYNERD